MTDLSKDDVATPWGQSTCRVPMFWGTGSPAGFCGKVAYGPQKPERYFNQWFGLRDAWTNQPINSWPYVSGHACPAHHGPAEGDPIIFQDGTGKDGRPMYCAVMPGFVNLQESHAEFDQDPRKAVKRLLAAKEVGESFSHWMPLPAPPTSTQGG